MRYAWTLALAACTSSGSTVPCNGSPAPQLSCATGGLVGLPFDAATEWTLTGTFTGNGNPNPQPYTATTTILRDGSGCGQLSIFNYGPAGVSLNDTAATYRETTAPSATSGLTTTISFTLCVDGSGALKYLESDLTNSEGGDLNTIDGTLTHP